jgi:hypothetical protein
MPDLSIGGRVGEVRAGIGSIGSEVRQGAYAELITNQAGYGRFFEATRVNRVFNIYAQAVTIASTHNTPLAAATGTPIVGFINISTNRAASILSGFIASQSGTPPANAQAVWNAAIAATTVSTAAAGTITPGVIGTSSSAMKPMNSVALTALNIAASNLIALRPFGGAPFAGAIAANHDAGTSDLVDGLIIVPPGAFIGIFAGTAAGTTWIVNAGMTWVEVDWPLS